MKDFDLTLYLITSSIGMEEESFLKIIELACQNGVTLLQLREKERSEEDCIRLAKRVRMITDKYGIPLIIDDYVSVALAVDAAGVHLGKLDMPISQARKLLGNDKIIGMTAKTVDDAVKYQAEGADYLGTGAIFPTSTKDTIITSVETLDKIIAAVSIPVVAIGGLSRDNLSVLANSRIGGIAVVSAIMKSGNPALAARELNAAVNQLKLHAKEVKPE